MVIPAPGDLVFACSGLCWTLLDGWPQGARAGGRILGTQGNSGAVPLPEVGWGLTYLAPVLVPAPVLISHVTLDESL